MKAKKNAINAEKPAEIRIKKGDAAQTPALSLGKKNVLLGNYPELLDLRAHKFKNNRVICLSGSDSVESIILPGGQFDHVIIENLPNLRQVRAEADGPTWMELRDLPKLDAIVIEGGTRWLSLQNLASLQVVDVGGCTRLGHLSVQNAPALKELRIEQCRLLPHVSGLTEELQSAVGATRQIESLQSTSRRDSSIYKDMSYTDIKIVMSNIGRAELLMKKYLADVEYADQGLEIDPILYDYDYRILRPGEMVYTGGTGESYCYAFIVSQINTSRKRRATTVIQEIVHEVGVHEPEDSIGEALRWAVSQDLAPPGFRSATENQILTYFNLLLSTPTLDPADWAKAEDATVRLSLAGNPLMPRTVLEKFADDEDARVRLAASENPAAAPELQRKVLHGLVTDEDPSIRLAVARNPATSPEDLEVLATDGDAGVVCAAAEHPQTTTALRMRILDALSRSVDPDVRLVVAKHPNTPEAGFLSLLGMHDERVFVAIADNASAPDPVRAIALAQLANSSDPHVQWFVAKNPLASSSMLASLAKTSDSRLLKAIASNAGTPPATLESLAGSKDDDVRYYVAGNSSTPASSLLFLARDKNEGVRSAVAGNLSASSEALLMLAKEKGKHGSEYVRSSVARNPSAPLEAFQILAKNKDWLERAAIAENVGTPASILEALSTDKEISVRLNVAGNPSAPAKALEILSHDENANVRFSVARHRLSPSTVLEALAADSYSPIRREVASNKNCPRAIVERLVSDESEEVRRAALSSIAVVSNDDHGISA